MERNVSGVLRIICCTVLPLLIMANGVSLAETFKCTRPDGSVFFTDDPSQAPRGCAIEKVTDPPPLGIIPETPSRKPPVSNAKRLVAPQTQAGDMKSFEAFKSEAALLVEKFKATRHRIARSSLVTDKLKARQELAGIKAQKTGLLSEINQSSLSRSEKSELASLLSPVTD